MIGLMKTFAKEKDIQRMNAFFLKKENVVCLSGAFTPYIHYFLSRVPKATVNYKFFYNGGKAYILYFTYASRYSLIIISYDKGVATPIFTVFSGCFYARPVIISMQFLFMIKQVILYAWSVSCYHTEAKTSLRTCN